MKPVDRKTGLRLASLISRFEQHSSDDLRLLRSQIDRILCERGNKSDDGIRHCVHGEPVDSDPVCIKCQRVSQVGMCYHGVMKDECEECRKTLPMYLIDKFKVK